ncbi:cag pathogenicity island protein [Helicobacter pylori]|uniref:cag pathogenicity island protein CagP n=1 Tax=Helicobacter pylori TaxID=210 RepID=UPI0009936944|nr:cag pathogenicity island protein CagP [Helicobacter pylori]OOP82807.1 cag pathogenicity island protein [Helicobacter pylori]PDX19029.1 cag pathogenicity island protein [Helicobacter pylori]
MKQPISKLKQNFLQFKHSFNKHLDKYSLYYRLFNISSIVIGFLIALFSYGAGVILVYPILFLFALIIKPSFFYYTTYLLLLISLSIISKYYLLSHANFTMKLIMLMTQWQNWFL